MSSDNQKLTLSLFGFQPCVPPQFKKLDTPRMQTYANHCPHKEAEEVSV